MTSCIRKDDKKQLKAPGEALEVGANVATAFSSRSAKAALSSLPELIKLYHTGKGLHLGIFFSFYAN